MKKFKKLTALATCAILAVSAVPLGASASNTNTQVPNDSISTQVPKPVQKKSNNKQISFTISVGPSGVQASGTFTIKF
ncbi:MAG: hypothetical protein K2H28_02105 [Ruminococcus sp.]|nr:hypothetical protein [Ruminococcus sp.]